MSDELMDISGYHPGIPVVEDAQNSTEVVVMCDVFELIWQGVVLAIIILLGCVGNILCLLVLYRTQRSPVTLLLLKGLSVTDLLYLLLYSFVQIWPKLLHVQPSVVVHYMLAYVWPLVSMMHSLSVWLIVLVTIHRYIVICHPLHAQRRSTSHAAKIQMTIITSLAVIIDIPRFFEIRVRHHFYDVDGDNETQDYQYYSSIYYTDLYHNYFYQLLYKNGIVLLFRKFLPLCLTIVLTIRLIVCLYKARGRRLSLGHQMPLKAQEIRITKTLLAVIVIFIICQFPGSVYPILRIVLDKNLQTCRSFFYYLVLVSDGLSIINSAVNFLVFMLCSAEFRAGFYRIGSNSGSSQSTASPPLVT